MNHAEYPVPEVHYVTEGATTSPVPPFNPLMARGEQLAWRAGCVMAQTNLKIRVYDGGGAMGGSTRIRDLFLYSFTVVGPGSRTGTSGMSFDAAQAWLHGLTIGAQAATTKETP